MTNNPLIVLENIIKTYQMEGVSSSVLKAISFNVYPGELVAIVGASGSGKSSLMNIIGLLDKADSGKYWLKKNHVADLSDEELAYFRNQFIGFVFQQFNLLPRFSALQNVSLPLTYRGLTAAEIKAQAEHALASVGMMEYKSHRPTQLSGGQQQRVAIARALVADPQVILADEPTGALDSKTGAEILQLFMRLNAEGRTIIMVTHDEQIAAQCARRIALADGVIIEESRRESA